MKLRIMAVRFSAFHYKLIGWVLGLGFSLNPALAAINTNVSSQTNAPRIQTLGGNALPAGAMVSFGGSFLPPTMEHYGLAAKLGVRFGFPQIRLIPTTPYKEGAPSGEVSLRLNNLGVRHFDEILDATGLPYRNFQASSGRAVWTGRHGEQHEIIVDDFEIKNGIKEDTLGTLEHLAKQSGNAKLNFWISGSDSFASVMSWTPGSNDWEKLFEHTNWLVVVRPGYEQIMTFDSVNPLSHVFPADFLARYNYYFDATNRVHVYKNRDSSKPDIFIVDQPALEDSSSKNRASLESIDHLHAQAGLQPSIFKECITTGLFTKQSEGYSAFTVENLTFYLKYRLEKIQRTRASQLTPEEYGEIDAAFRQLITLAEETAKDVEGKPKLWALITHQFEHIVEGFSELKDFKAMARKMRALDKRHSVGKFIKIYLALEVLETTVFPVFMFMLAGPAGAAIAPFMHPNEIITIPAYLAIRLMKEIRFRRKLGGGSLTRFYKYQAERNKHLRGNPEAIIAKTHLARPIGFDPTGINLNVVKSRMPAWVPYWIRLWDNRKIKWWDFNISSNELYAIIDRSALVDEIRELTSNNPETLAQTLIRTIYQNAEKDPLPVLRLELFLARRYFNHFVFPQDIPAEILVDYSATEQSVLAEIREKSEPFYKELNKAERVQLAEDLADFYAISKQLTQNPNQSNSSAFWSEAINQIITQYPGRKAKKIKGYKNTRKMWLITSLMAASHKDYIENEPPVDWNANQKADALRLRNAALAYLRELNSIWNNPDLSNPAALAHDEIENANGIVRPLPLISKERSESFLWEVHQFLDQAQRSFDNLEYAFDRSKGYLKTGKVAWSVRRQYSKTFNFLDDELRDVKRELLTLEFEWSRYRSTSNLNAMASDQALAEMKKKLAQLRIRFESIETSLSKLSLTAQGLEGINISSKTEVKEAMGQLRKSVIDCRTIL